MGELVEAFVLGNGAILTNVCMLPLYPGLVAYLAASSGHERAGRAGGWLAALVLAGVLSLMLLVGLALFLVRQSFGAILPWLLPLIYGAGSIVSLADGLLYSLAFGLGFGWPLGLLPLVAAPAQRRFTHWLTDRSALLTRASGTLLIAIGLFGAWTEILPNL